MILHSPASDPMKAMKDWHKSHPHIFIKSPRNHAGRET